MRKFLIMLLTVVLQAPGAQGATAADPPASYSLGKTKLSVAAPPGFHDPSARAPELLEGARAMISAPNRVLAMYVSPADIDTFVEGHNPLMLRFFMLAAPASQEYRTITPAQFDGEASYLREKNATILDTHLPGARAKNDKLSASIREYSDDKTFAMNIGEVLPLGIFYDAPGAITSAWLAKMSAVVDGKSEAYPVVVAYTMLQLKDKLVFQYTYSRYRSKDDIQWTRDSARHWAIAA